MDQRYPNLDSQKLMKTNYTSKAVKRPTRMKMTEYKGHVISEMTLKRILKLEPEIRRMNEVCRYNIPDMSARLGLSVGTLRNYLVILGIELLNYKPCERNNMKNWGRIIPHMIANGKTYKQIAKRLNTSDGSICRWVCNNGLSTRNIQ